MTAHSWHLPELLAPVGGMEQLTAALRFGADAVYGGLPAYGLRASAANFTPEELRTAVAETHRQGKRFYVALNMLPLDSDLPGVTLAAGQAADAGADAVIVSDLGAALAIREALPEMELHISTQANVLNTRTARHYYDVVGAKRVVLAREMSLADIRAMRALLPAELELEAFVHGAMCVAYSGRCLLSAAFTGRSANRGECAQPCRWRYAVAEEKRPGKWMPVEADERATALFSAYDLCMLDHLPALLDAGVASVKIEGRMKTAYYVATVVSAYRRALDLLAEGGQAAYLERLPALMAELGKASHRASNTGFYFGAPQPPAGAEGVMQTMEFVGQIIRGAQAGMPAEVELKNRFYVGDTLEALTPAGSKPFAVQGITLADTGEAVATAGIAGRIVLLVFPFAVEAGDILRGPNRNHIG